MTEERPNRVIDRWRVAKINRLIARQIELHVECLTTLTQLRRSIEKRMFHGQLHQSDLDYIRDELERMKGGQNELKEHQVDDGNHGVPA